MASWRARPVDENLALILGQGLGLRPLTARLMLGRGLGDSAAAARFLDPRLSQLRPPTGIADLERALHRLQTALAEGQLIGVFGDYDVDGITSAAILTLTLRALGGNVIPRIADRTSGYGLTPQSAARFVDEGCQVLVTGDCGTSDHEALALCRARGVDAIVIDHHQIPEGPTGAFALINPHRADDTFAFKSLASCGLAFYLAAALRSRLRDVGNAAAEAFDPRSLLDLVALGTVADMVPLVDENRSLVAAGLRELSARRRPGLRALGQIAELQGTVNIRSTDVSFRLTPRLNAAGRMGEAQRALDLLLATEDRDAQNRAQELDDVNRDRQRVQELVWLQAVVAAELQIDAGASALVVGADGWHQGVVGIVAAKLVDKYRLPAVVVGFTQGQGRGSARTLEGFNLYRALVACSDHLITSGGHAAAAGLSVAHDRFDGFRTAFLVEARRHFDNLSDRGVIHVDAVAQLDELDVGQAEELERLGPFGAANAEPLLVIPSVTVRASRVVGKGHLQLTLSSRDGTIADAIAFGMATSAPGDGARIDLIGTADVDTFRGYRRVRLRAKHLLRTSP